jgi:hypothetical protein
MRPLTLHHRIHAVLAIATAIPMLGCYSMHDAPLRGKTLSALREGDEIKITGWIDSAGSYHSVQGRVRRIDSRTLELENGDDPVEKRPGACDTLSRHGVRALTVERFDPGKTIVATGLFAGIAYAAFWGWVIAAYGFGY